MTQEHEDKGAANSVYELGYHLVPSLAEDTAALRAGELGRLIETIAKGKVIEEGEPERFELAYTMRKMLAGKYHKFDQSYFGWLKFEAPAPGAVALKGELDHIDDVLRFIIVKTTGEKYEPTEKPVLPRDEAIEGKGVGAAGAGEVVAVSQADIDKAVDDLVIDDPILEVTKDVN